MSKLYGIIPLDPIVPPKPKPGQQVKEVVLTKEFKLEPVTNGAEDAWLKAAASAPEIKVASLEEDVLGPDLLSLPLEDYLKTVGSSYEILLSQVCYAAFSIAERPRAAYYNDAAQTRLLTAVAAAKAVKPPQPAAAAVASR